MISRSFYRCLECAAVWSVESTRPTDASACPMCGASASPEVVKIMNPPRRSRSFVRVERPP